MHKYTIITTTLLLTVHLGFAAEPLVAEFRITPADVVPASIQQIRFSTNNIAVRWTFTEAGAKKMIDFREAHDGQRISTAVGDFVTPPYEWVFRPLPPPFANYAQWRDGWLKHRTDKMFVRSKADADKILIGLKGR
jgi:hypothetical protein